MSKTSASEDRLPENELRPGIGRRAFLGAVGMGGLLSTAAAIDVFAWEPYRPTLVETDLPLANWPTSLDGLRVLQLTDIHYRGDHDNLESILEICAPLAPHIVALTGDFVNESRYLPEFIDLLRQLPAAPLGHWAVLGNHEYYTGIQQDEYSKALEGVGIQLLINRSQPLRFQDQELRIAGLDESIAGRPNVAQALENADPDQPTIMLVHEPELFNRVKTVEHQIPLTLAGHTHGGQIRIPFWKAPVLPIGSAGYDRGIFTAPNGRRLYVSSGLGWFLLPMRLACRPEINLLTLRHAPPVTA